MDKKPHKHNIVGSIEDASIIRKFTILFLLMSVIPTSLLYYFYTQIKDTGTVQITEAELNVTLTIVVVGVIVGYWSMRSVLQRLVNLTISNQRALEKVLSPTKIKELSTEKNEIAVLAQSFTAITERLEENVKSLELAKRTLHSVMTKVGQGISNMQNINTFLELILETLTNALSGKTAVLMTMDSERKNLKIRTVYGADVAEYERINYSVKDSAVLKIVLKADHPIVMDEVPEELLAGYGSEVLFKAPLVCAPLIVKEKPSGIIIVSDFKEEGFDEDAKHLLYNLASQTAVAVENSRLNKDIERTYFETISALALAVDAKDKYSRGHLDRVAKHCVTIGKKLGLDEEDMHTLRDAARLHDLGKIGIPDEVLNKTGKLTDQERLMMEKHAEIGESIIKPIRSLGHLCDLIRHHHEKLDGSGYPDGLKGEEISPLVRILTVADIYDAVTTDRPYRKGFSCREARKFLQDMNRELDQDVVSVFIEALEER